MHARQHEAQIAAAAEMVSFIIWIGIVFRTTT
jgi:hypothetical protein